MFFFRRRKKSDFHILIIDDEKDFISSIEFWFKRQGYSVEAVMSGGAALEAIKAKDFDLIFLDVFMPMMDGLETLRQIRELKSTVPVVMISAHFSEEVRLEGYKLGVNAFLDKTQDFYKNEHLINSLVRVASKKRT